MALLQAGTALAVGGGYLVGSIPFGLLLTRAAGHGDIRAAGSGNIGATNVLRVGGKVLGAATLLLDGAKGAVVVWGAAVWLGESAAIAAAAAAVIGHDFPIWLRGRGGKGVATTLGALLALSWPAGLVACGVWLLTALCCRISSLAALAALTATPLAAWGLASSQTLAVAVALAILGWGRHHANIRRLAQGQEPRFGVPRPH